MEGQRRVVILVLLACVWPWEKKGKWWGTWIPTGCRPWRPGDVRWSVTASNEHGHEGWTSRAESSPVSTESEDSAWPHQNFQDIVTGVIINSLMSAKTTWTFVRRGEPCTFMFHASLHLTASAIRRTHDKGEKCILCSDLNLWSSGLQPPTDKSSCSTPLVNWKIKGI